MKFVVVTLKVAWPELVEVSAKVPLLLFTARSKEAPPVVVSVREVVDAVPVAASVFCSTPTIGNTVSRVNKQSEKVAKIPDNV